MKLKTALAALSMVSMLALPLSALAQSRTQDRNRDHRQDNRSQNRDRTSDRTQNWEQNRDRNQNRDQNWNRNHDRTPLDGDAHYRPTDRRADDRRWNDDRNRSDSWRHDQDSWHRQDERFRYDDARRRSELNRIRQDDAWNRRRYDERRWNNGGSYSVVRYDTYYDDRRGNGSEWRDIAAASGIIGILGLLDHDNYLAFSGLAGALYSLDRYEDDRRSSDDICRARAVYFSRSYFYRDGVRYNRRTISRDGHRYYQFCRG